MNLIHVLNDIERAKTEKLTTRTGRAIGKKNGRQAILIEREEKYCEMAVKRIEQESTDFFDIN